jgi:hypothetical protein
MHMFFRPFGLLVGLVLMVAGCGDDGGSGAQCDKFCTTANSLKCPNTPMNCVAACQQLITAVPKCQTQLEAVVNCSANQPVSNWECAADGEAEIKDGFCDPEGQAAAICILSGS